MASYEFVKLMLSVGVHAIRYMHNYMHASYYRSMTSVSFQVCPSLHTQSLQYSVQFLAMHQNCTFSRTAYPLIQLTRMQFPKCVQCTRCSASAWYVCANTQCHVYMCMCIIEYYSVGHFAVCLFMFRITVNNAVMLLKLMLLKLMFIHAWDISI